MAAAVVAEFCFGLLLRHLLYIHAEASIINVCPTTTNPYSAAPNYIFFFIKNKGYPKGTNLDQRRWFATKPKSHAAGYFPPESCMYEGNFALISS